MRGYFAINASRLPARLHQLGIWISKIAHQPAAVWWAGKQLGLHPEIQQQLQWEISHGSKPITPVIRQAWRYLLEDSHGDIDNERFLLDWVYLKTIIDKDGWSNQTLRKYASLNRPYLKVTANSWRNQKPPARHEIIKLSDMLSIEVEYPVHENDIQIPDGWLAVVIPELRKNLEYALQLDKELGSYHVHDIGPILADDDPDMDQNSRIIGLYGSIISFSNIFERLLKLDIAAAQQEFSSWPINDQCIFDRLRIWAAGLPELISEQTFESIMLELHDDVFWDFYSERDLLLILARRWNQLHKQMRQNLEKRLLQGREKWDYETTEEFIERNAWMKLNRLHWLAEHSCRFTFDLEEITKGLQKYAPDWNLQCAKNAATSTGVHGGFVRYDESYSILLNESLATILSRAVELGGRSDDFLIEKAPYAGLCKAKPVRAFSALTYAGKNNEFPEWAWRTFLYSESRHKDKPRFSALIAERITRYPAESLIKT